MEVRSESSQEEYGLGQDEQRDASLAEQLNRERVVTLIERFVGYVTPSGGQYDDKQEETR